MKIFSEKQTLFIILVGFIIIALGIFLQYQSQLKDYKKEFNYTVESKIKKEFISKISEVKVVLTSLASFYESSEEFSTASFNKVTEELMNSYPLIVNVIYTEKVDNNEIASFYEEMTDRGMYDFNIYPKSNKSEYSPIVFIVPSSYQYTKYYGYDMFQNKNTKEILDKATRSADIYSTSTKILKEDKKYYFLIKSTYYGFELPDTSKERILQNSGHFIVKFDINRLVSNIKKNYPSYNINCLSDIEIQEEDIFSNSDFVLKQYTNISGSKLSKDSNLIISKDIYLKDINLYNIGYVSLIILLIYLILIYILYNLRKNYIINKDKESQFIHNSKMITLKEIITDISHQWRQPLSSISTLSTGLILQKEHNLITTEEEQKVLEKISDVTQKLSLTLTDFQNLVEVNESEILSFNLSKIIHQVLYIKESVTKQYKIKFINSLDDTISMISYPQELMQVILNIIYNSSDQFKKNTNKDNLLFITSSQEKQKVTITIKDNAGGINKDIIHKIFDAYFTTKFKAQGTGLGLFVSYNITKDKLKGDITTSNIEYEYKNKIEIGVEFKLVLPINIKNITV